MEDADAADGHRAQGPLESGSRAQPHTPKLAFGKATADARVQSELGRGSLGGPSGPTRGRGVAAYSAQARWTALCYASVAYPNGRGRDK